MTRVAEPKTRKSHRTHHRRQIRKLISPYRAKDHEFARNRPEDSIDHIVALRLGGNAHPTNEQSMCTFDNSDKNHDVAVCLLDGRVVHYRYQPTVFHLINLNLGKLDEKTGEFCEWLFEDIEDRNRFVERLFQERLKQTKRWLVFEQMAFDIRLHYGPNREVPLDIFKGLWREAKEIAC